MRFFGQRKAGPSARDTGKAPDTIAVADLPKATIAFCEKHRIHPIPAIYETVYSHLSKANEALSLALVAEMARGHLTQHVLLGLHQDHVATGDGARQMGEIGAGLGREVDQIAVLVEAGIEAGSSAKCELSQLTDQIDGQATPGALARWAQDLREIGLRQLAANIRLREQLRITRHRLGEMEVELEKHVAEANTDHLTKLPNRRAFDRRLKRTLGKPVAADAPGCLVMIDIDHFKALNDAHGHDIGDSVIRMFAAILKKHAGPQAYPARWGGEEFAILLEAADHRSALRTADAIRTALGEARWTRKRDGVSLGVVTASLGIAQREATDTPTTLVRRADAALYRAKSEGRNRSLFLDTLPPGPQGEA